MKSDIRMGAVMDYWEIVNERVRDCGGKQQKLSEDLKALRCK